MISLIALGQRTMDNGASTTYLDQINIPKRSMGMVYLPTWMVMFMVNVGKYTIYIYHTLWDTVDAYQTDSWQFC